MAKELKEIICKDLESRFSGVDGCVLVNYRGLNSEQTQDLRSSLRQDGVTMSVVQNRLARRVFADQGMAEEFRDLLVGPTAVLVGEDGALTASRLIVQWRQKNKDLLEIKGGLFEGKALSVDEVERLAKIPTKETLQSQIAAAFLAPAVFIASVTQGLLSHFASANKAQCDSKGGDSKEGDSKESDSKEGAEGTS
jgi:large subunit ribosomal protein L10